MNNDYLYRQSPQEHLATCSIEELNGLRFWVPSYQRGYRWTSLQVNQLLSDIAEFEAVGDAFYCLQPIVVRRRATDNGIAWELIDGQQRLTSIWLMLRVLGGVESGYSLDFDTNTRQAISSKTLVDAALGNPPPTEVETSLEANYIRKAADTIRAWKTAHENACPDFLQKLLRRTRVIWYETAATDGEAQAIFSRLNAGKIPLTNAELIKALLLKRGTGHDGTTVLDAQKLEVAADWNQMQATLAQRAFWGWLKQSADESDQLRLEWLLRLVQRQHEQDQPTHGQPLALFQAIEQRLRGDVTAAWGYWQEVRATFLQLQGWFDDPDFYHRIGYLLATGDSRDSLDKLLALSTRSKSALLAELSQRIAERAGFTDGDPDTEWDGLRYGNSDNYLLKKILLLHNVATAWQARSTNGRFAFDRYNAESRWSLEHVHPQNPSDDPSDERIEDLHKWLTGLQGFLSDTSDEKLKEEFLPKAQKALLLYEPKQEVQESQESGFRRAAEAIRREYYGSVSDFADPDSGSGPNDKYSLHSLSNLALLSSSDNSSLSNGTLPEKRAALLGWHRQHKRFVPPATLNVFLKMYSTRADDLRRWTKDDRADYQEAMRQSVLAFLGLLASTKAK